MITRSFNIDRLELALHGFCRSIVPSQLSSSKLSPSSQLSLISSPEFVSQNERFILSQPSLFSIPIQLEPLITGLSSEFISAEFIPPRNNFIGYRFHASPQSVKVWFLETADSDEVIRGVYHCLLVRLDIEKNGFSEDGLVRCKKILESSFDDVLKTFKLLGWEVVRNHLADGDRRIRIIVEK